MTIDQRRAKGEETKARIIEAAIMIVSEEGSKGLSAKKVAERAGVSKSNIFHHFGSVEDIQQALLSGICASITEPLEGIKFESLESFFKQMGKSTFSLTGEELAYYKVLFSFYNDTVHDERYQEQLMGLKYGFIQYLQDMVMKIEGINLSEALAEIITVDIDGMGLHYLIDGNREKYSKLWDLKCKMYISEIRA